MVGVPGPVVTCANTIRGARPVSDDERLGAGCGIVVRMVWRCVVGVSDRSRASLVQCLFDHRGAATLWGFARR